MTHDETRVHSCGEPMTAGVFGPNDPTPQHRSQPILVCHRCNAWEPDDGWQGPFPDGWDGQSWSGGEPR